MSVKLHQHPCSARAPNRLDELPEVNVRLKFLSCYDRLNELQDECFKFLSCWLANWQWWLFNRPIKVRTQILAHRWGPRTRILVLFHRWTFKAKTKTRVKFACGAGYYTGHQTMAGQVPVMLSGRTWFCPDTTSFWPVKCNSRNLCNSEPGLHSKPFF